ncbi:MAG: type II secretion system protein M [Pseudomonadota bacterium]
MKDWFLRFSPREQLALLLMTAAVTLYAFVLLVLMPLGNAREEMVERNIATATALARVDGLATEISELRKTAGSAPSAGRNLTATVNRSAERFGLRPSRLQPNSRGGVQVRFETAALEPLLRWLHALEDGQGLLVEELSLSQTQLAGTVSATVRIAALQ